MSDAVKWAMLAAAIVVLIATITAMPFMIGINAGWFSSVVFTITDVAGSALSSARGLINNFLTPFGRYVLTSILYYLFGKWVIGAAIKVGAGTYHFVFK